MDIESYFTLFESILASKSNPLLAVEELYVLKQGSMILKSFMLISQNSQKI